MTKSCQVPPPPPLHVLDGINTLLLDLIFFDGRPRKQKAEKKENKIRK
jgi:hypothetical protein